MRAAVADARGVRHGELPLERRAAADEQQHRGGHGDARRAPGATTAPTRAAASAPASAPPASMRKHEVDARASRGRRARARAPTQPQPAVIARTTSIGPAPPCAPRPVRAGRDPFRCERCGRSARSLRSRRRRPGGPAASVTLDDQRQVERPPTGSRRSARSRAGRRRRPALAQQQHVGEAGRDLLDVVRDQHERRRVRCRRRARPAARPGPRGRRGRGPAAGSSSSISSGSVISARAICTRLRSPSLRVPNVRSARCADAERRRAGRRRGPGRGRRTCSRQRPTTPYDGGEHDVAHPLAGRQPVGDRRARQADPRPQLEDVDRAEPLAEHVRRRPSSGASGPAAICSSVVLPAPFGPRTTQRSPSRPSRSRRPGACRRRGPR